jgi:N-acetylglutamate synthase-like GNAT family acetyltransferase
VTPTKPQEPLSIRSAMVDDAEVVTRIYIESWNAGFGELLGHPNRSVTPELVVRWGQDLVQPLPQRWWVAEKQGTIVGLVGIGPSRDPVDARLGELDTIAVDPRCWRSGIGRELLSLALRYLAADGYGEAILWTVAGYERGKAFYEAMGWRLDGGVRDEGRQVRYRHSLAG